MKNILSSVLVACMLFSNLSYADGGYIFRSAAEKLFRNTSFINVVTNIPILMIKPDDDFEVRVYVEDHGSYDYQFKLDLDGENILIQPYSDENKMSYKMPSNYEKASFTIDVRNKLSGEVNSKTLINEYLAPMIVSKEKVYQKEEFVISHPALKTGVFYNVVFNDGEGFFQKKNTLCVNKGELITNVPQYQGQNKISISVEGIKTRERKKISIYEGGALQGSSSVLKPFETLYLTILDGVVLEQDHYAAQLNGRSVEMKRVTSNILALALEELVNEEYHLEFFLNNQKYQYNFKTNLSELPENPHDYLALLINEVNSRVEMILSDSSQSELTKTTLRQLKLRIESAFLQLDEESIIYVANFLKANIEDLNEIKNIKNLSPEAQTDISIASLGPILNEMTRLKNKVACYSKTLDDLDLPSCLPHDNEKKLNESMRVLVIGVIIAVAVIIVIKLVSKGATIYIFKKLEEANPLEKLEFKSDKAKEISALGVYTNLNKTHRSSNESRVGFAFDTYVAIKNIVEEFNALAKTNLKTYDAEQENEKTVTLNVSTTYLKNVQNILPSQVKFKKMDYKENSLELTFTSEKTLDFTFDIRYDFPGVASNKFSTIQARILEAECEDPYKPYLRNSPALGFVDFMALGPWYDSNYGVTIPFPYGKVCRIPEKTRSIFNHPTHRYNLALAIPAPQSWVAPSIEYVGCTYDGKISKSLFRFSSFASDIGQTAVNSYSSLLLCSENVPGLSYSNTDRVVANQPLTKGVSDPEYFSLRGYPYCYNYKHYMVSQGSRAGVSREVGEINLPVENCSDCTPGLVKINGVCRCPEGTHVSPSGCQKDIICEDTLDYYAGKCVCPQGKPYGVTSLVENTFRYVCNPPSVSSVVPPFNNARRNLNVQSAATFSGCSKDPGWPVASFNLTVTNTSSASTSKFYFYCKSPLMNGFGIDISKFPAIAIGPGQSASGIISTPQSGECYTIGVITYDEFRGEVTSDTEVELPYCAGILKE